MRSPTLLQLPLLLLAGGVECFVKVHPSRSALRAHTLSRDSIIATSTDTTSTVALNLCFGEGAGGEGAFEGNGSVNNRHAASDWLYNVKSLPNSQVLREIRNPVLSVAGWSFAVSVVQRVLSLSSRDALSGVARSMCIPGTAHSFLVSALGLLLVFRTNSAYQRFYEGRKIWENILSISRNLSRMIQLYSKEVGPERKQRVLNLVAAYPYLLRHHVRPGCLCEGDPSTIEESSKLLLHEPSVATIDARYEGDNEVPDGVTKIDTECALSSKPRTCEVDRRKLPWSLFSKKPLTALARAKNRPLWVCDRLGREMVSIPYGPNFTSRERLTLLSKVEKLTDAVGQCERIHQTAVPLNYARHSLRSLTLWLFTLPFALVKDLGLLTAPVTACIAWLLFGVYQIGYSIEDPFQGTLRLSILCDAIRRDVLGVNSGYDADDGRDERWTDMDSVRLPSDAVPPLLLDESLLNVPKLVREHNGTWNVVGLVQA